LIPVKHLVLLILTLAGVATAAEPAPAAQWNLDGDGPGLGKAEGGVIFLQEGPPPQQFRQLPASNRAARFDGLKGGLIRLADPGERSPYDFDNGDALTIEAWVNPASSPRGGNLYILGKGRTANPGQAADNQNYALRLWDGGGLLRPSFLFRSRKDGTREGAWHRWTTTGGIATASGWHHVAITYEFGKPESIRGYIDGESVPGAWDMGGPTTAPPVVDNDEIWIGSSMGKRSSVNFDGLMDEVRLIRAVLPESTLAARYPVEPYTPTLPREGLPEHQVRVEIVENIGKSGKWPRLFPEPTTVYAQDVFGFSEIAMKYTGSGVRAERSNPYLLRAMARLTLPPGRREILLRSRGQARLWVDGKVIAGIAVGHTGGGAHNEVEHEELPGKDPALRLLGPGDRETTTTIESDGQPHDYVFEMIAGNGRVRATLGETSLSVRHPDGHHTLLTPSDKVVPLTDAGWHDFRREQLAFLAGHDRKQRQSLRARQDPYWQERHEEARKVLAAKPPLKPGGVDSLLEAAWARAAGGTGQSTGSIDFARQIRPILAENCFRCHEEKAKGGLRLNSLEAARQGGDSGEPAIVPGNPGASRLLSLVHPEAGEEIMPPKGGPLAESDRLLLTDWIRQGASFSSAARQIVPAPLTDDLAFLRRVTLDTVGVVPAPGEIAAFLADAPSQRRNRVVDRLLDDPRRADHWTAYWQDVLAENPNILKPSLNNSGPFRFWIHEALTDHLPMDRFVTELVRMEGGVLAGGPAGFAMAAENDVPMAAKAHILSTAFLGQEMTCARCHDSPYHQSKQADLFAMAAMLNRKAITLPASSSVPAGTFAGRKPLIPISLKPGDIIPPVWPALFSGTLLPETRAALVPPGGDSREQLAALITSPWNDRFPQVIVNRVWKQLMGRGFVEPVDDWEAAKPSHPELLDWLAREFVSHGYDLRHLERLILTSAAYQRAPRPLPPGAAPDFAAPLPRRMTAEQIVDSLFAAAGKELDSEELTMDNDGTQSQSAMISLGHPRRAWEFTSLSNERDRPSLAIPKAQVIVDVLETFGWRPSRQDPKSVRETAPNVRQPAILANGALGRWVTTLSESGGLTTLALRPDLTEAQLIDATFLRLLTRHPTAEENATFSALLGPGFADRIIPEGDRPSPLARPPLQYVSWSNHLSAGANRIKIEMEKRAREGDPPTTALVRDWRERFEDMIWALLNSPEFVHLP
jgi:hypothetical protein